MLQRNFATGLEEQNHGHPGLAASGDASASSLTEVERLRRDLERLQSQQAELMQLIGTTQPERLVHDIRNVLQERMLLEAACKRYGV